MIQTIKLGCVFGSLLLWGCSSSSGGESPSSPSDMDSGGSSPASDAGPPAQEMDSTSAGVSDSSSGSQPMGSSDGSPANIPDTSVPPNDDDAAPIQYAASCGDGGAALPTPTGQWSNASGNLAGLGSECGNMSNLSVKPDEDMLIAGIAQQGLWASQNGGGSWTRLGTGSGSATITNRTSSILYDPDHTQTFWESGIYNAGGVYKTADDGATFAALGNVTHNDSISVDFTDPQRQTLLAGTHEQSGHLFRSANGGSTWTDIGPKLPSGTGFATEALVIDSMTHLVGVYTYQNTTGVGIYRTTDGGNTWKAMITTAVQKHPLVTTDGVIYWSLSGNGGLVKSSDKGQTWQKTVGSGVLVTSAPIALPDGRLASLGNQGVLISSDCGTSWHLATTALPYSPTGFVYSPYQKAFYVWHFDCTSSPNPGDPVPADAIMKYDFDYQLH
jgi:photosystem II stability/assembly factor-like uncharacterized protein